MKPASLLILSLGALLQADASAATLVPSDVVANIYHSPDSRADAFLAVTDDPLAPDGTFDTYDENGIGTGTNDFTGLIFSKEVIFDSVTLTLVEEFSEGDGFLEAPKVYLLNTQADPGSTDPSSIDSGYIEVGSISGYTPDTNGALGAGTFTFDFTTLPLGSRTGFGFAIGGVPGGGVENFINVGALSAAGSPVPEPTTFALCGLMAAGFASMRRRRN